MNPCKLIALLLLVSCLGSAEMSRAETDERLPSRDKDRGQERITDKSTEKAADRDRDKTLNDVSGIVSKLDYPELQVVPRASERLRMEAREEEYDWYFAHWQIEASGLATLVNAIQAHGQIRDDLTQQQTSQESSVAAFGELVGVGWVAAGVLIGAGRPYRRGVSSFARYNGKDEYNQILKERLAEESLERSARLMGPLVWLSVVSNLGTNLLIGSYLSDQGRVVAGASALLSLLPLIYEDHAISAYKKHLEYKTRIYRPLSSMGLGYDYHTHSYIPMAKLAWSF